MIGVCFGNVIDETHEAYNLFTDYGEMDKDRRLQQTLLEIRKRFGDNSGIRLLSLRPEATGTERNNQIGGHQADYQINLKYGYRRKEQKDGKKTEG